jgi:hypothetical protein
VLVVCVCVEGVVVVAVDCATGGALDTVTVFVDEPQAASSAAAQSAAASVNALVAERLTVPSYSPPARALLASAPTLRASAIRLLMATRSPLGGAAGRSLIVIISDC